MTAISRPFDEELLTPGQVAALFCVDPKTVSRWAKAGKIGFVTTLGGHRRYRSTEVHALLRSLDDSCPS
ncbi:BldC family transcriptional regulator [Rhodococcus sp. OK302]|uniref:BldC family transcriptional regulator n=1 Tax=Rhodococcus sp. OK302 TaxID=1882769 RepID=UPI000B942188|nr:BldC family transcriptional regulator [Rhodococcus sp. OK302]